MKKIIYKIALYSIAILLFSACDIIQQVQTLSNCTFEFTGVTNFKIASISLDKVKNLNEISVSDAAKIITAIRGKTAQISFDVKIKGNNPNRIAASIDKMQYILLLDNQEILQGALNERFTIPAIGSNIVSLQINIDAIKILNGNTIKNVYTLYQNITGKNSSNTSKLSVKVKPTINNYTFPSYITLTKKI